MTFLEILGWMFPIVSFGVLGFAEGDGGNGGDGEEEGEGEEEEEEEGDPKIKEIQKDPDAVKNLLETKRKANAEAKKYRLELEKIKREKKESDDKDLKEKEKFKELSEKLESESKASEAKFKTQIIKLALRAEAVQQGISDPDLISLIDIDEVNINDEYEVENAKEVIEGFKEKKPHFFKKAKDDEEDEDDIENEGPEDEKPNLHSKVKGTKEGLTPDQRIRRAFEKKSKKKKK